MKKRMFIILVLIFLFILLAFTGCTKAKNIDDGDKDISDEELKDNIVKGENEEEQVEKVMEKFKEILDTSPTPDVLIKFMDRNIDRVSPIDGDQMMDKLERSLENNIIAYQNLIFELDKENELMAISGDELSFKQSSIGEIKNDELRKEIRKLYSNMYKLENIEGGFYPIIDYAKLKTYMEHITPEWEDYLMIRGLDSEDRPMSDGSLNISFDELANRILKTEGYLNNYINGLRQQEMLENYENKMNAYLKGLPNTPISDSKSKRIYDEVLDSYKKTENTQSYMTSYVVYEYLELIKGNDYIVDEAILKKADGFIEEALRLLREFK